MSTRARHLRHVKTEILLFVAGVVDSDSFPMDEFGIPHRADRIVE